MTIAIRPARAGDDVVSIKALLEFCDLPGDIQCPPGEEPENFFVVTEAGKVVACAGLEIYPPVGLVRSLAVDPSQRSRGFGAALLVKLIERAEELEISEIYGLTVSAKAYLQAHGFALVPRSDAPPSLLRSAQFKIQCPTSAVLLRMNLA